MNDIVLKINLPDGFWTKIQDGRYMGTIQIQDALFRLEAVQVKYHRLSIWRKNVLHSTTSVQSPSMVNCEIFDAVRKLAGDELELETIEINHHPHVAYMTPYSKVPWSPLPVFL